MAKPRRRSTDDTAQHRAELDRLARQPDAFSSAVPGGSPDGADASDDPAEIWGRRIGRGLGVILLIALLFWLTATYLTPQ